MSVQTSSSLSADVRPVSIAGVLRSRLPGLATVVVLAMLVAAALWIRLHGLAGWDGTLTVDESRLALAARGVLESGVPLLPSGWMYTRGLLVTYLTAPSLAILGETDFAARLPAALAGTALIPVGFALGREVAGRLGGLFVAAILTGHPSLVVWSRQAWFYAAYVLLFALSLLYMHRALRTGRSRDQIAAGALVGLTLFTHEIGVFLVAPLVLAVGPRLLRSPGGWSGRIGPLVSLLLVGVSAAVLWILVTRLRAESLVGSYGEIDEYLSPSIEWARIRFYLRMLLDGPGLMALAALGGLAMAVRRSRLETAVLWLALLPTFAYAAFLIPRGPQERYGLTLILVTAVLGVQGVRLIVGDVLEARPSWLPGLGSLGRSGWPRSRDILVGGVLLAMLLAHQDVARAVERAALSPREGSWLRQVRERGIGPGDVVMTDVPTVVGWYVGGLDFWVSSRDYDKYTTRWDDVRRDVHTGATLIRNRGDYERLVGTPLASQTVWVIASGRSYQWGELVDDDLKSLLERSATRRINPGDNFRILVLDLPSGS